MGRPGIAAAGGGRPTGGQGAKAPYGSFVPLDNPSLRWPLSEAFAAKRGLRGSVPCVEQILGRCKTLNFPFALSAAHNSARPDSAGRWISAAKSSASIKDDTLSTRRPCFLVFRRATGGSRVQKGWGARGETHWCPCPFVSAGRPRHPLPPKAAMTTPSEGVKSPPAARRCIGGKAHPLLRDIK